MFFKKFKLQKSISFSIYVKTSIMNNTKSEKKTKRMLTLQKTKALNKVN